MIQIHEKVRLTYPFKCKYSMIFYASYQPTYIKTSSSHAVYLLRSFPSTYVGPIVRGVRPSATDVNSLVEQTRRMDERLAKLRSQLATEKTKWDSATQSNSGSYWSSATTKVPLRSTVVSGSTSAKPQSSTVKGMTKSSVATSMALEARANSQGRGGSGPAQSSSGHEDLSLRGQSRTTLGLSSENARQALGTTSYNNSVSFSSSVGPIHPGRPTSSSKLLLPPPTDARLNVNLPSRSRDASTCTASLSTTLNNSQLPRSGSDLPASTGTSMGSSSLADGGPGSLLQGTYNEAEAHRGFAEARAMFLGQPLHHTSSTETDSRPPGVIVSPHISNTRPTTTSTSTETSTDFPEPGAPGSLLQGTFDEAANARDFAEARRSWLKDSGLAQSTSLSSSLPSTRSSTALGKQGPQGGNRLTALVTNAVREISQETRKRTSDNQSRHASDLEFADKVDEYDGEGEEGLPGALLNGVYDETANRKEFEQARLAFLRSIGLANDTSRTSDGSTQSNGEITAINKSVASNTSTQAEHGSIKPSHLITPSTIDHQDLETETDTTPGSLLYGNYDEEANQREFQAARLEFLESLGLGEQKSSDLKEGNHRTSTQTTDVDQGPNTRTGVSDGLALFPPAKVDNERNQVRTAAAYAAQKAGILPTATESSNVLALGREADRELGIGDIWDVLASRIDIDSLRKPQANTSGTSESESNKGNRRRSEYIGVDGRHGDSSDNAPESTNEIAVSSLLLARPTLAIDTSVISRIPSGRSHVQISTQPGNISNAGRPTVPTTACYNCYKLVLSKNAVEEGSKTFCSDSCSNIYKTSTESRRETMRQALERARALANKAGKTTESTTNEPLKHDNNMDSSTVPPIDASSQTKQESLSKNAPNQRVTSPSYPSAVDHHSALSPTPARVGGDSLPEKIATRATLSSAQYNRDDRLMIKDKSRDPSSLSLANQHQEQPASRPPTTKPSAEAFYVQEPDSDEG